MANEESIVQAILFDTRSIQKYIFSGNKLRTNIGASYIVDQIFETILIQDVLPTYASTLGSLDTDSWKHHDPEREINGLPADCYVAYIGGGNALVLFKKKTDDGYLKQLVMAFSKQVLVTYPGLKTGAAIGEVDLATTESFQAGLGTLYKKLKDNQNTIFPCVNIPYTGFTLACEVNGEVANFLDTARLGPGSDGVSRYISQEVWAKTKAAEKANERLHDLFQEVLQGTYRFPMELSRLGQKDAERDIAIVHIDGNQMGVRFNACKSLAKRSALSNQVKNKTLHSFSLLLADIVAEYADYGAYLDLEEDYLPIRPLILGGDDITFICPARVALTYAKRFMEYMDQDDGIITVGAASGIKSCGGIAILPEAYPFFRGYELAEQLCDAAKEKSRREDSSWLDFAILHGEQAPELDQIRINEYTGALGNMHFGPYRVDDATDIHSIDKLIQCITAFSAYPQSKLKQMRYVLQHGKHDIQQYMEQFTHTGNTLPAIAGWEVYADNAWYSRSGTDLQTPYVDAIEMMDYMPIKKEEF